MPPLLPTWASGVMPQVPQTSPFTFSRNGWSLARNSRSPQAETAVHFPPKRPVNFARRTHARCASPPGPPRRSHRGRPSAGVTSRPASGRWAGSWWSAQSGAHDKTGAVRRRAGYRRQAGPVLSCAPAGPTPARIPADHRGHASPPEPTCPGRRGPMATIPAFLTHLVQ